MRQPVCFAALLGLLAACAPSVSRAPETQIRASAQWQGHLLTVTLLNTGPNPLLLENSCPRPFGIDFLDYPGKATGALKPQQYDTCWNVNFPPQVWQVGESLSTGVTVDQLSGAPGSGSAGTLKVLATARVKVIENGNPRGNFAAVSVPVPPVGYTGQ